MFLMREFIFNYKLRIHCKTDKVVAYFYLQVIYYHNFRNFFRYWNSVNICWVKFIYPGQDHFKRPIEIVSDLTISSLFVLNWKVWRFNSCRFHFYCIPFSHKNHSLKFHFEIYFYIVIFYCHIFIWEFFIINTYFKRVYNFQLIFFHHKFWSS